MTPDIRMCGKGTKAPMSMKADYLTVRLFVINEGVQGDAQRDGEGIKGWGAHTPLGLEDVNEGDSIVLILR